MIKLLDKATIDKIAAGEVIERPSSVVKELLENSIDAGATSVTVEIKDGGISLIRVTDNGCGIPKEEVRTAYMRHATSKIESANDLSYISSLGFRGEALSTIAAVSQTEMITKTSGSLTGVKYVIHGGKEIEYTEVGVPDGTTIVVRNLFFNTPARKKFLKSAMTEGSYINDLVLRLALSHVDVSFKLIINGQTKIDTAGNGNVKDAIYQLFGRDITSNLIPVSFKSDSMEITGYIGKPYISRGNRGLENYFINERYIKSNIINRAIEEGYKTFIMQHKFPFTVLYITLPKYKCDVNVHPTKMEFKYDNERELFESVMRTVNEALNHKEIIPKDTVGKKEPEAPKEEAVKLKPAEPFEAVRRNNTQAANSTGVTKIPDTNYRAGKYSPTYTILEKLKQEADAAKTSNNTSGSSTTNTPNNMSGSSTISISNNTSDSSTTNTLNNMSGNSITNANNILGNNSTDTANTTDNNKNISNGNSNNYTKPESKPAADVYNKLDDTPAVDAVINKLNDGGVKYTPSSKMEQTSLFDDDFLTEKARKKHRVIGQLFDTYWLIEYEKNLYIMDQHAAHEKVNYERLIKNLNEKQIYSQQLMPPMVITVSYAERQAILDNYDLFMKIGYDIEEFGGNEFKINAVPSNLYGIHGRDMFLDFVGSLIENAGYMSNDVFVRKLSTMACKAAIKGNMHISFAEADALIDELLTLDNPYTCPHGRPTIISISETELEKKFHRIVT